MENYLEALERLGKLLDSGVLTKAEFEREKTRLLSGNVHPDAKPEPKSGNRKIQYAVAGSLAVVAIGGTLAYSVYQSIADKGYGEGEDRAKSAATAPTQEPARLSISFADATTCEPGPSLSELLARIREAGATEEGSTQRLVYLAGTTNPVEVKSAIQDSGRQQVRLAGLPVSAQWQGLKLIELRTMDWEQGSGYQLHFAGTADGALRALKENGFAIDAVDRPKAEGRDFIAVERGPDGAIVTCIKSNAEAGIAGAATELDQGGE